MDQIVRMIARDMPLKAMAITGTALVERARSIHETTAVATAALGRSLMAASMIGHTLKEENASVTLRINGGGPLGNLLAVSDNEGNVRGYVQHPQVELPSKYPGKLDVGAAVGKEGALTLIKDLNLKEPYVGTVPLVTGKLPTISSPILPKASRHPPPAAWACWSGGIIQWRLRADF